MSYLILRKRETYLKFSVIYVRTGKERTLGKTLHCVPTVGKLKFIYTVYPPL